MQDYLISAQLGLFYVRAKSAAAALVSYWTEDHDLVDCFLSREQLLERGFRFLRPTKDSDVYLLLKEEK